jgi:hypothetical protein
MIRAISVLSSLALAGALLTGCGAGAPALPSIQLPSFDTTAIEVLVSDAIAEVERVVASPPAIDLPPVELPPDLASLLDDQDIQLPPLPSNAAEICQALGTPTGAAASTGLSTVIQHLLIGGEAGLVVGVLVTVVSRTCPVWMPHLATAVEQVLRR